MLSGVEAGEHRVSVRFVVRPAADIRSDPPLAPAPNPLRWCRTHAVPILRRPSLAWGVTLYFILYILRRPSQVWGVTGMVLAVPITAVPPPNPAARYKV